VLVNIAEASEEKNEKQIKEKMKSHAGLLEKDGIPYMLKVGYGEFFTTIPKFLAENGVDLVIVGTHGIKGIADASYGLNILRLIGSMKQPTMIVQGHCEIPHEGYDNILIPNIQNTDPLNHKNNIIEFASYFNSKITVLDYLKDESKITEAESNFKSQFGELVNSMTYDYEIISDYVHSFSRSISQYTSIEDNNLIIWTDPDGRDMFSDEDKENLILNRYGVAVLFIPRD
jgi:hypothetical protein